MTYFSSSALTEYIPNRIWLKEYPIRFAGCRFNARMTVIRLSDGRLLIHSPRPIDQGTKKQIEALGSVAAIIAPGNYHYLNVKSAQDAFPDAETHLCPGVAKKDSTIPYTKTLSDDPDSAWDKDLDQVLIRGSRFITEVAFFHRETATLILVDLIENYGDHTTQPKGMLKFWWKFIFQMWNHPKPAPEYQLGWKDKGAARKCLKQILNWDFDRIIIAHGDLIENDAKQTARRAWQAVLEEQIDKQVVGYYSSRKSKLLSDLDYTLALMNETVVDRYGEKTAQQIQDSVRAEFETLIPEIPFIKGMQAKMLNLFLRITAQELAVYKAFSKLEKSPEEAWQLCHQALRLRTAAIPKWKRWIQKKLMFSKLVRAVVASRAKRQQVLHSGGFEIEYLDSEGEDFDIGVNYRQCGNYRFVMGHGGEEFAPYICMSDIALSDAMGWGLKRTQTLADGCDHCDFRMKKGATTRITSKTPEVQRAIDKIHAQELAVHMEETPP